MFTSAGGFLGSTFDGETIDCYSTGVVSGDGSLGGFCGGNWGDILQCFWDIETSGQETSDGGEGRYTGEMKIWTTYEIAISPGSNSLWAAVIWAISVLCNDGYPCLINVTPFCAWAPVSSPSVETDPATDVLAHGATLHGDLTVWG